MTPRTEIEVIAKSVAAEHGVTVQAIFSPRRTAEVVQARWALWAALRAMKWANGEVRYSLPRIGLLTGGWDHSTVLHGLRRHAERMGVAA